MDPATRLERWESASRKEQLKLHNEALRYGETILTPKEAEEFAATPGVPTTATMARELDEYWPGRVPGLHEAAGLLSFHGLYQGVYRVGSRQTHGTFAALDPYVRGWPRRRQGAAITVQEATEQNMLVYSLAAPLLGMALLIAARSFIWLDDVEISALHQSCDRRNSPTAPGSKQAASDMTRVRMCCVPRGTAPH